MYIESLGKTESRISSEKLERVGSNLSDLDFYSVSGAQVAAAAAQEAAKVKVDSAAGSKREIHVFQFH